MVRRLSQTKIRKKNKKLTVARKNKSSRRLSKKRSNKGRKQKGGRKTRRRSFKKTISQIGGANSNNSLPYILACEEHLKIHQKYYYKLVIYDSNGNKYYIYFPISASDLSELELARSPIFKNKEKLRIIIKMNGNIGPDKDFKPNINNVGSLNSRSGTADPSLHLTSVFLSFLNTKYVCLDYQEFNIPNYSKLLAKFLIFISNNRNNSKGNKYPMTFHFKLTDFKNKEYGFKNPVPWCPDLISFVAKALKPAARGEDAVVQEPLLPFGINEQYVNYKFTFLEKTRCALHITKDTVSEAVNKLDKTFKAKDASGGDADDGSENE